MGAAFLQSEMQLGKEKTGHANPASAVMQARKGGFKDTPADDLLCAVLVAVLKQTGVEPEVTTSPPEQGLWVFLSQEIGTHVTCHWIKMVVTI